MESQRTPIWARIFTQIINHRYLHNNRQSNKQITGAQAPLPLMQAARIGLSWVSRTQPKLSKGRIASRIKQLRSEQAISEKALAPETLRAVSQSRSQIRVSWSLQLLVNKHTVLRTSQTLSWDVQQEGHKVDRLQLVPWVITSPLQAISLLVTRAVAREVGQQRQSLVKELA